MWGQPFGGGSWKQKDGKYGKKGKDKKSKKSKKSDRGHYQHQPPGMLPPPNQNFLADIFHKVDRNGNGQIDANELRDALSNGTWAPFNASTVRLMISLFDRDYSGTINFQEFGNLWKYVQDWHHIFQQYDRDRSGNIDMNELQQALTSFGYTLSARFYEMAMARYDRTRTRRLNLDDFMQLCIVLQMLTASFKERDTDRRGTIQMRYEDFLLTFSELMFRITE